MIMPNADSASLGIRYSLHAPNASYAVACAAGTAAIGHAFRSIRGGETNFVLCGGAEFVGDPFGGVFRVFDIARALTTGGGSPATANRPFDTARTGLLMAEGGACLRGMGARPPSRRPHPRRDRQLRVAVRRLQHGDR